MKSMSCEVFMGRLQQYFRGELSDQDELEMDDHLDRCEACTEKLKALLESEEHFLLSPWEQTQILQQLRASYTLDPDREQKGIEKVLASTRPFWSEPAKMLWAAANLSGIDEIRERMGAEFEKRGPIHLESYTGELYVRDQNSAILEFRKEGRPALDLNGKTIEFFATKPPKMGELSPRLSETIQAGIVVIDFTKLGLSLEDYAKVHFKLYLDESTVMEGSLGEE
ncbi:MAG TPA: zf-HC2 domain-containing protein [Candidatus Limnocylindrales bacterium]|nr:zf-HC2 domain-containing protein [Candidatus Limnocylindrales bacterium]